VRQDRVMPSLTGQVSICLTVVDVDASSRWYAELFDLHPIREFKDAAGRVADCTLAHPSGLTLGLISHESQDDVAFDERRPGLDHLEFIVPTVDEVHLWANRLDELGIAHSGVKAFDYTAGVMVTFRDPDNIQLEFYAFKSQKWS
jgi:glyoxylase I family protein